MMLQLKIILDLLMKIIKFLPFYGGVAAYNSILKRNKLYMKLEF
jgi:hypothetical protein